MANIELTAGVFNVLAETYSIIGQNHEIFKDRQNDLYDFLFEFFDMKDNKGKTPFQQTEENSREEGQNDNCISIPKLEHQKIKQVDITEDEKKLYMDYEDKHKEKTSFNFYIQFKERVKDIPEINEQFLYEIVDKLDKGKKLKTKNGLIKKILEKLNITYFGGFDFDKDSNEEEKYKTNTQIQKKKRDFLRDSITSFFEKSNKAILVCPEFDYNLADIFEIKEESKYGETTIINKVIKAVRTGYKYKGIDMTDFENFEVEEPVEAPKEAEAAADGAPKEAESAAATKAKRVKYGFGEEETKKKFSEIIKTCLNDSLKGSKYQKLYEDITKGIPPKRVNRIDDLIFNPGVNFCRMIFFKGMKLVGKVKEIDTNDKKQKIEVLTLEDDSRTSIYKFICCHLDSTTPDDLLKHDKYERKKDEIEKIDETIRDLLKEKDKKKKAAEAATAEEYNEEENVLDYSDAKLKAAEKAKKEADMHIYLLGDFNLDRYSFKGYSLFTEVFGNFGINDKYKLIGFNTSEGKDKSAPKNRNITIGNNQAIEGKFGYRDYNTDFIFKIERLDEQNKNENKENIFYSSFNSLDDKVGLFINVNPIVENGKRLTFPRHKDKFYWLSDHLLVYKDYGTKQAKGGGNPKKTLKNYGEKKIKKKLSIKTKKRNYKNK